MPEWMNTIERLRKQRERDQGIKGQQLSMDITQRTPLRIGGPEFESAGKIMGRGGRGYRMIEEERKKRESEQREAAAS
jgi:hypothetical protein